MTKTKSASLIVAFLSKIRGALQCLIMNNIYQPCMHTLMRVAVETPSTSDQQMSEDDPYAHDASPLRSTDSTPSILMTTLQS